MELRTNLHVNGGEAVYSLASDGRGTFQAILLHYNGDPNGMPPQCITLVRGLRKWTGSSDNEQVLQFLGEVIDSAIQEAPIFRNSPEDRRIPSDGRSSGEAA